MQRTIRLSCNVAMIVKVTKVRQEDAVRVVRQQKVGKVSHVRPAVPSRLVHCPAHGLLLISHLDQLPS